jgi:rRNA-processing protein FCF1
MKKIILDTNALMAIDEFKIDLFSEINNFCDFKYKLYVLQGSIDELNKIISDQRGKYQRAAKLALGLIKAKKVEVLSSSGDVDDLLVNYSKKEDLVLTQDIELKKRLQKPYLIIRQKKYVRMVK